MRSRIPIFLREIPAGSQKASQKCGAFLFYSRFKIKFDFIILIILISIAGTTTIAFLTVGFQAYKAAKANPVEALKYE
ncbi:hypothetical protein [Pedobacter miscanthi]|uniref:ABC3 transporter permease protein domain-containing protein n=1 Tax=Pedobacter miscanthi TaxID=2259170 RepID=A0A366KW80_9SPHI|nr:hypothetical protein [Pedobacter miscanthi]RBQ05483.1 hypothetical protein DRW42_15955 [Pedobacter miscanthi]